MSEEALEEMAALCAIFCGKDEFELIEELGEDCFYTRIGLS